MNMVIATIEVCSQLVDSWSNGNNKVYPDAVSVLMG
jgi:hypothetical protein